MGSKKQWVSGREAAELLTELSGHKVDASYGRMLAREGKIKVMAVDGRTNEYLREDVEKRRVKKKRTTPEEKPIEQSVAKHPTPDAA